MSALDRPRPRIEWVISEIPPLALLSGRYSVIEKLGDGAAASVYKALDQGTGQEVAIKILDPLRATDPVARVRLEREFEVLSGFDHPGLARSLRLDKDGELDLLVLEQIDGPTLRERLDEVHRFAPKEAVELAAQLAVALEVCHAAGVLHRDLKPENIVLHPTRGPVILDFGAAWLSSAANLTRTGAVIGSPRYLAPEVFSSSLYDARADVYALGVILFEMLTGRPVYLAESIDELVTAHGEAAPPAPITLRPKIGADLNAVVMKAIAPIPEDRFLTAAELAAALLDGRLSGATALRTRLPCTACKTRLILDLPFCPGCGRAVDWTLSPGRYVVEIRGVRSPGRALEFLKSRYPESLGSSDGWMLRRLRHPPVALIARASLEAAEQLAAEAKEHGMEVAVLEARTVLGVRPKASSATKKEMLLAGAAHALITILAGTVLLLLGGPPLLVFFLPFIIGLIGWLLAGELLRRPLLVRRGRRRVVRRIPKLEALRSRLVGISTDRARRIAALAIARAVPALDRPDPRPASAEALDAAVDAVAELDAHLTALHARSRARLQIELEAARARADRGDPAALDRVAELEVEKKELVEISLAHDLAARKALAACARI